MSKPCKQCNGSGQADGPEDYQPCPACQGTGVEKGKLDTENRLVILVSGGVLTDCLATGDLERIKIEVVDADDKEADGWTSEQLDQYIEKVTKGLKVIY